MSKRSSYFAVINGTSMEIFRRTSRKRSVRTNDTMIARTSVITPDGRVRTAQSRNAKDLTRASVFIGNQRAYGTIQDGVFFPDALRNEPERMVA